MLASANEQYQPKYFLLDFQTRTKNVMQSLTSHFSNNFGRKKTSPKSTDLFQMGFSYLNSKRAFVTVMFSPWFSEVAGKKKTGGQQKMYLAATVAGGEKKDSATFTAWASHFNNSHICCCGAGEYYPLCILEGVPFLTRSELDKKCSHSTGLPWQGSYSIKTLQI